MAGEGKLLRIEQMKCSKKDEIQVSKELTNEEVREKLLTHIWHLIEYWDKNSQSGGQRDRLEGVAFSILVMLDGGAMALPGFVVAPRPCEEDKDYHIENGEDYYPRAPDVECDIGGGLHELFHDAGRKLGLCAIVGKEKSR